MMVRVPYVTRSGDLRVYEYAPPERDDAVKRCRRSLVRVKVLYRVSPKRWQSGPQGRRFQNATVEQLIARGEAVRDGDVVRARNA
jgi:hypothetical protein